MNRFAKWLVVIGAAVTASPALAAQCVQPGGFSDFISQMKSEASAQGVGQKGLAVLNNVSYDAGVISYDRKVRASFKGSFEQFAASRVTGGRVSKARAYLKSHAALLSKIESQFGVPAPVILAIWGMETDFGAVTGKKPIVNGLASLASDCRRPELFQRELIAVLKIVDQNVLSVAELRGAGHGELGQTQFLPSSYLKFAVDYDGDGKKDLMRSSTDVLASTANYLRGYGWQRGGSWQPGSANFAVLSEWNKSPNYQRAIALFADKVAAGS